MASIKIADLFAQIGARVDVRQLNKFQKRLAKLKKQLLQLKRIARTPLSPNTNIAAIRALNTELARTVRLSRQIQQQGPIRVRRAGGAAARGGGRIGPGVGGGSFLGGLAGGAGAGRVPVFARNFVAGFTGAIVIRQVFQATAAMQGIEVALSAITREGQTTGEVMAFLRGEADRLGFDFRTSALEFAKLAAAGNAAGLSTKEIQEIFISAQESARVFNLSIADTEGILKAFTQIISKGKVTAEELRNQLGDRLPAAVPLFARALGVTTQELGQMLEKGEILANDALPKFAKTLRETFAEQVPAAAQNLTAAFNRFGTRLFEFSADLGKAGIGEFFADIFNVATAALDIIAPVLKVLIRGIRILIAPLRAVGRIMGRVLDSGLPPVVKGVLGVSTALIVLRVALNKVTAAWVRAVLPIIAAGLAIGALVILIDDLATALEGGDSIIGRMAKSTNIFFSVIAGSLINLGKMVEFIAELAAALAIGNFDELTESLKRFTTAVIEFFSNPASEFLADLVARFTIDPSAEDIASTFALRPGSPGDIASRAPAAAGQMQIDVTVISGEGLVERVETVIDGQLRQAHGENGNNE